MNDIQCTSLILSAKMQSKGQFSLIMFWAYSYTLHKAAIALGMGEMPMIYKTLACFDRWHKRTIVDCKQEESITDTYFAYAIVDLLARHKLLYYLCGIC